VTRHLLRREVVFDWRWFRRRPGGQMGHHTAAVLNRDLALVVFKEDPVLIQLFDFAVNFPSWLISRMTFRWSVLKMICGSRLLPMDPPTLLPKLPKRIMKTVLSTHLPIHQYRGKQLNQLYRGPPAHFAWTDDKLGQSGTFEDRLAC
jgi:hypothetical protein